MRKPDFSDVSSLAAGSTPSTCRARELRTWESFACQDDVSRLLPSFDVSYCLDQILQRVAAIDDRAVLPCLDELLEQEEVLLRVATIPIFTRMSPIHRVYETQIGA